MNSHPLIQFQADVLNNRTDQIRSFIQAFATEGTNQYLHVLATDKGFTTFWDEQVCGGKRIMLARDLAKLCYNTEETASLIKLCQRKGVALISLSGASFHNVRRLQVLEYFGLSKFVSQQNFATWDHVMVAAANGETEAARKVWADIQAMALYGIADAESRRQTGEGVLENAAAQSLLDRHPDMRAIMDMALKVAETREIASAAQLTADEAKTAAALANAEALEARTEAILAKAEAAQAHTEAAQANAHAQRALDEKDFFTVAEYVTFEHLGRKIPKAEYRSLSDFLRGYCIDHSIPCRDISVGGKPWKTEIGYHRSVYVEAMPGWLHRRYAQGHLTILHPPQEGDPA
jgi:hypothetical protein